MTSENKEEKVEVTEYADGTIKANGIQIFPPQTLESYSALTTFSVPQTPEWETKIREDYKGVLNEEWIEKTIEYWRPLLSQAKEEGRAEIKEKLKEFCNTSKTELGLSRRIANFIKEV